jgi:NAD-dependent deacetylase sirtuin 2
LASSIHPPPVPELREATLNGVAELIRSGEAKRIVWLSGAGISASAGIPDFRTPGTGLYDNLEKYNLPYPEAVFDLGFFRKNPMPFFLLAKELLPGKYRPTPTHRFVQLLHEKGLLLRCWTQNIDGLEREAGIPAKKLVEAHGTFATAHCVKCGAEYSAGQMRRDILSARAGIPTSLPHCSKCGDGIPKPDIVFFGEDLPVRFAKLRQKDLKRCDLLVVAGTSLLVQPFASLPDEVRRGTPRLLINREPVGAWKRIGGMRRVASDVAALGDCDEVVKKLADALGWADELAALDSGTGGAEEWIGGGQLSPLSPLSRARKQIELCDAYEASVGLGSGLGSSVNWRETAMGNEGRKKGTAKAKKKKTGKRKK